MFWWLDFFSFILCDSVSRLVSWLFPFHLHVTPTGLSFLDVRVKRLTQQFLINRPPGFRYSIVSFPVFFWKLGHLRFPYLRRDPPDSCLYPKGSSATFFFLFGFLGNPSVPRLFSRSGPSFLCFVFSFLYCTSSFWLGDTFLPRILHLFPLLEFSGNQAGFFISPCPGRGVYWSCLFPPPSPFGTLTSPPVPLSKPAFFPFRIFFLPSD